MVLQEGIPSPHLDVQILQSKYDRPIKKIMTCIFESILYSALVYIDDILLYSKTIEEHFTLLNQFLRLVQNYGIMLSERKCIIGQDIITFLGMKISDGQYEPGPHIAEELQKFPTEKLTITEIQQFLGIINYIKDFIPNCSAHTSKLSKLLKKNVHDWGDAQTTAIKHFKAACQTLHSLRIPSSGQQILQTDASDEHWGAILLEKVLPIIFKINKKKAKKRSYVIIGGRDELKTVEGKLLDPHLILICHRPYSNDNGGKLEPIPMYYRWKTLAGFINNNQPEQCELYKHICFANRVTPEDTMEDLVYTSLVMKPYKNPEQQSPRPETRITTTYFLDPWWPINDDFLDPEWHYNIDSHEPGECTNRSHDVEIEYSNMKD
ncbi:hypothetical protein C2S52_009578 [Perilla frutescens var. hirtella]|nr:hypothetical protein C2S52_009578 [Perilla frutescens var. hirtella]